MKPSVALSLHREAVRALIEAHHAVNPRVFGSVAAGTDTESSDLDLLVDTLPGITSFDLIDLNEELQTLLGVKVDLMTPGTVSKYIRRHVVAAAQPL